MGLLRTNEFAELCGIKASSVRTYISRNKISYVETETDNGRKVKLLDTEDPVNILFINKCASKQLSQQTKPDASAQSSEKDAETREGATSNPQNKKIFSLLSDAEKGAPKIFLPSDENSNAVELDREAKYLTVLKAREQVEIERMKKEKMQGEVIPTDLVKQLFNQHFKNLCLQFKDEAEKIATVMVKSLGGKNADKVEIFSRLEGSINRAIDEARELTALDIKQIVMEHSAKRGIGERK